MFPGRKKLPARQIKWTCETSSKLRLQQIWLIECDHLFLVACCLTLCSAIMITSFDLPHFNLYSLKFVIFVCSHISLHFQAWFYSEWTYKLWSVDPDSRDTNWWNSLPRSIGHMFTIEDSGIHSRSSWEGRGNQWRVLLNLYTGH